MTLTRTVRLVCGSTVPKTVGALALLQLALPFNAALTVAALTRRLVVKPQREVAANPRTIMISGGKMTKALQLARSFHQAGHRVILVESNKYRLTGHRFSRCVDRFYAIGRPQDSGYTEALVHIARTEGVDLYVPVCSPASSYYDAVAKPALEQFCQVLHSDADLIARLDNKYEFAAMAAGMGLPVPDTHLITAAEQVTAFDFTESPGPYILKSIPYDPVHRLDLTPLPGPTRQGTEAFAASKPMSEKTPWIMQELVHGQEYCTHSTAVDGELLVYCCCKSSAFQLNYEAVDKPEIEKWVRRFVGELALTGQVSFDFIEAEDGRVLAIECNPRTHSAITMFYNHPDLARAYLDHDVPTLTPLPTSKPTYWFYQELWRLLRHPSSLTERIQVIVRGKDAIFDWSDPVPFFMVHHVQIPRLLLHNLRHRKAWLRVDVNIGKLVEPAGD